MKATRKGSASKELTEIVSRACLIAKDAAFNVGDYIANSSRIAFVAVQQCERELDDIERQIDQSLPSAITGVGEAQARELLACLKFITDLERIGDLLCSAGNGVHHFTGPLSKEDRHALLEMCDILQKMLESVYQAFIARDVGQADSVLRVDTELDHACRRIFRRHLLVSEKKTTKDNTRILFVAQALERAGDHAKNLAEEVIHLVRGQTLRHSSRARLKAD